MSRWLLNYDAYDPDSERTREALCTLGNGYFAARGAAPESSADDVHYPGTYVAGCYNRLTSEVGERTTENEDLVNVPNWLPLTFKVEGGEWFHVDTADLMDFRQELDMRRGVLTRLLTFRDGEGRVTHVTQRRIVSMDEPHLAALEMTITPENWSGRLEIRSAVDGEITNAGVARYRALESRHLKPVAQGRAGDDVIWLQSRTTGSQISVSVAARTHLGQAAKRTFRRRTGWVAHDLVTDAVKGVPVTVEKVIALFTSRDRAIEECAIAARTRVSRAGDFDTLLKRHTMAWARLWLRCQISLDHEDAQQVLNLHMFHLLQTVSEHTVDLDVGVPARGLHGEAYRGHIFWDELFILPFLSLRFPEIARAVLMYRWRRLPEARWAACQEGYRGAMYPWQSGSDGREETQRLHLNPLSGRWLTDHSHLQRHVGLAIACNVWRFYEATGDLEFLAEYGAAILLEVARFFSDLATYNRATDRYEIRGVMGPDEYHDGYPDRSEPGVDNNAYTNVMTAWLLRRAIDVLGVLPEHRRTELMDELELTGAEISRFEDVSRKLKVVIQHGVISQFEGYDDLAELDWPHYLDHYGDIRRLDRILEAEGDTPNRYKVSKQADVLMLFYLLTFDELKDVLTRLGYQCEPDLVRRTLAYYHKRTCHGSTLSSLVHAWLLAHADGQESWQFFLETLNADIDDSQHGTTAEGVHLGAMAGTVDLVQRCYAGVHTLGGTLRLNPRLPAGVNELRLGLRYRGNWGIDVSCRRDLLHISLRPGAASSIEVAVPGHERTSIQPGGSWEVPLVDGHIPVTTG